MEENKQQFQCTGDCLACSAAQRQYCASQHAYRSMRTLERLEQRLDDISRTTDDRLKEITQKIEAIQNNEALVFDPNKESVETIQEPDHRPPEKTETPVPTPVIPTAQQGDGADK